MIEVIVKNPQSEESFVKALSKFKRQCNRDGFLKEIRDRRYYKKPCEIRIERERARQRDIDIQNSKRKKLY